MEKIYITKAIQVVGAKLDNQCIIIAVFNTHKQMCLSSRAYRRGHETARVVHILYRLMDEEREDESVVSLLL